MKFTMLALASLALVFSPTAAAAQTQVVFGFPANPVAPVPFFIPSAGFFNNSYPYPGFYHHYLLLSDESYNPNYEYTLSGDLQYEFPIVGNFQYE
ncbi:hypothetical protein [Acaryochloris marina]|nr:hypothetical protein [Acaryochloris marina]BDM82475.1 hypothetical protein AM10699_53360 [Acaryochloris marina MBIC10699]